MDYLISRLKEKSTWLGMLAIVTSFGVVISPELSAAIGTLGTGLAGLVLVIIKERKKDE